MTSEKRHYDVVVIGGGIAGVSVAYELAGDRRVGLVEMEGALAQHSTGRSAAAFLESYGGPAVRALTKASRLFFTQPPEGFDGPLLSPRALVWVGAAGRAPAIQALEAQVRTLVPAVRLLPPAELEEIVPVLRPGWAEIGLIEPDASDIDVAALHQGYARGLRRRGGAVHVGAPVVSLHHRAGVWVVATAAGDTIDAPVVVNAAGAWVDLVAGLAGVPPIGIRPLRRSLFMLAAPDGLGDIGHLPLTADVDETFYFKPEGPQFLCSPADESRSEPCDARPEEIDIARALDRLGEATTLPVRHVRSSWAGLRSFVADRVPVAGFDPRHEGFFWLAGQGGYGIQTAPALSRTAAALVRGDGVPADVAVMGVTVDDLGADRPGLSRGDP